MPSLFLSLTEVSWSLCGAAGPWWQGALLCSTVGGGGGCGRPSRWCLQGCACCPRAIGGPGCGAQLLLASELPHFFCSFPLGKGLDPLLCPLWGGRRKVSKLETRE